MKPRSDPRFTAHVGIDWADAKHDVCLQAADSEQREFDRFSHQVGSIDQWAKALHQRFGGPIAVALELAKGPIVYALQKYDFFVLFPINPATLAKYREAFKPSGAKDDPTDAELALDLLLRHPERFPPLKPQSVAMRMLLSLMLVKPASRRSSTPTMGGVPSSSTTASIPSGRPRRSLTTWA